MKKIFVKSILVISIISSLSSCATVFGGRITASQKRTPYRGQPAREIRVGALIADLLLFWPGTIVDFATGAIYKP
jgi:hypothetical protein